MTKGRRAGSTRGRVPGARRVNAADVGLRCACPASLPPARPRARAAQVVARKLQVVAKGQRAVPSGQAAGGRPGLPHVTAGSPGGDDQPGGPGLHPARQGVRPHPRGPGGTSPRRRLNHRSPTPALPRLRRRRSKVCPSLGRVRLPARGHGALPPKSPRGPRPQVRRLTLAVDIGRFLHHPTGSLESVPL